MRRQIEVWKEFAAVTSPDAWVFPSENPATPVSRDSCWKWGMKKPLTNVGLAWAMFLVMRRTNATLMKQLGADPKLKADQLGHRLDMSQNLYTQRTVTTRLVLVNQLEKSLLVN